MARTKERWQAKALHGIFREGRAVVIPLRLDHDPDRVVELRIQLSSIDRFMKTIDKEANPPKPVGADNGGKHYSDEF